MENWKELSDEDILKALRRPPWHDALPLAVLFVSGAWLLGSTFYAAYWVAKTYKPLSFFEESGLVLGALLAMGISARLSLYLSTRAAEWTKPPEPPPAWVELSQRHGQGGFDFDLQTCSKLLADQENLQSVFLLTGQEQNIQVSARLEFNKDGTAFIDYHVGPKFNHQPTSQDLTKIKRGREEVSLETAPKLYQLLTQAAGRKKRKRREKRAVSDGTLEVQTAWLRGKNTHPFGWLLLGQSSEKQAWQSLHELTLSILRTVGSTQEALLKENIERALLKRGFFFQTQTLLQGSAHCFTATLSRKNDAKCWVGGNPKLTNSTSWPLRNEIPLSFLAQLSCAEVGLLGRTGSLAFFIDASGHRNFPKEKNHCCVVFLPDEKKTADTPSPAGCHTYSRVSLDFSESVSLPEKAPPFLPVTFHSDYQLLRKDIRPHVQCLGFGHPERRLEMDEKEMCHKVYPQVPAQDFVLLLQLHQVSDVLFEDTSELRFYIPKSDLANGDFERVCAFTAASSRSA